MTRNRRALQVHSSVRACARAPALLGGTCLAVKEWRHKICISNFCSRARSRAPPKRSAAHSLEKQRARAQGVCISLTCPQRPRRLSLFPLLACTHFAHAHTRARALTPKRGRADRHKRYTVCAKSTLIPQTDTDTDTKLAARRVGRGRTGSRAARDASASVRHLARAKKNSPLGGYVARLVRVFARAARRQVS